MHIVNNTKNARLNLVILLAFLDSLYVVFCLKVDFSMLEISLMTSVIVSFNLYLIFDYVRICCEYNVDESGITAIWSGKIRKNYKWEEFVDIHTYVAVARHSRDELLLCSTIPAKEVEPGVIWWDWVRRHPFRVLYFDQLTPQEKERFYAFVPRE